MLLNPTSLCFVTFFVASRYNKLAHGGIIYKGKLSQKKVVIDRNLESGCFTKLLYVIDWEVEFVIQKVGTGAFGTLLELYVNTDFSAER
jgi:hypothetical protein